MRKYYADEALKKAFADKLQGDIFGYAAFRKGLLNFIWAVADEMPPADVVEERHGEWVRREDENSYWYECSLCHNDPPRNDWGHEYFSFYCPACGAKMAKEDNDE